jgi:hypothetical protein
VILNFNFATFCLSSSSFLQQQSPTVMASLFLAISAFNADEHAR